MLDIRRLELLKAVVDAGSITAAARTMGYSPSAISQSLTVLEREAKTTLFERAGRGLRPTEAALLLARHAEGLLTHLERAEAELDALRSGKAGRFRVAAFGTAGASLVPKALARFKKRYPQLDLDLLISETHEALAALRAGTIDLALVGEHRKLSRSSLPDLDYTIVLEDPYRVVVPRSHPIASADEVSLGEFRDESWISTASARCNCLETVTNACARAGFTPDFALEADEFATTIGFVAAGLGVSMVPMLALSSVPDAVRVLRIRSLEPKRYVYAVTRPVSASNVIIETMLDALRRSAGSHLRSVA